MREEKTLLRLKENTAFTKFGIFLVLQQHQQAYIDAQHIQVDSDCK